MHVVAITLNCLDLVDVPLQAPCWELDIENVI